jgi:hypothetical protein
MTDWKVGDRVRFEDRWHTDTGVVVRIEGRKIWARWSKYEVETFFLPGSKEFTKINSEPLDESAETKAVTLLLSLGYTLKKGV